jgi:hypothetical protein
MSAFYRAAPLWAVILVIVVFPAEASDRTEADFVKACAASSNLPPPVCECSARKAKGELTAGGFALLVATLEGNDTLVAQLRSSLPLEQVMKAGTFMTRGPAQCAKESAATQ